MYFPWQEREALARTVVRKHDIENYYHCNTKNCGKDCLFFIVMCPNENCEILFNKKNGEGHDRTCPQKIVPCDRLCGESMARCTVENHKEHSCPLRYISMMTFILYLISGIALIFIFLSFYLSYPNFLLLPLLIEDIHILLHLIQKNVFLIPKSFLCHWIQYIRFFSNSYLPCFVRPVLCPFSTFGCMAELVSKNLPDHMDSCTNSHLLLVRTLTFTLSLLILPILITVYSFDHIYTSNLILAHLSRSFASLLYLSLPIAVLFHILSLNYSVE